MAAEPFSRIPVMYVSGHPTALINSLLLRACLEYTSDLINIRSLDSTARKTLAKGVKQACVDVGFFYGVTLRMLYQRQVLII